MQFGPVPVSAAKGAILAHSVRTADGYFKKGRVLLDADVEALRLSGLREVVVAHLEHDDIAEDLAAARVAALLAGRNVRLAAAFTGRVNLYAETNGLACIDAERISALNRIDEAITVTTLSPWASVAFQQMIATVKIIPFAAPRRAVEAAEALLSETRSISLAPFAPKRMALISTTLPETRTALLAKSRAAIDARLAPLGSSIVFDATVEHETGALAAAIAEAKRKDADPILIFGASAITDRRDVIPAAIVAAGGRIVHFGMPVDPGNLLLLGQLGRAAVVGLPSCARSPKRNGFDFVLQRLVADMPIEAEDIAAMGVGGLLSEIHTRPQPRDRGPEQAAPHAPRIAAVILAAGLSSRMGRNKLTAETGGVPLIRRVALAALASSAEPVIVVTGNDSDEVERALAGVSVVFVNNPAFRRGLSSSLICGIGAVPENCDGALILLGDMPEIDAGLVDKLVAAFSPEDGRAICIATHRGKRGNPVLWSREFFADIGKLEGDVGAKVLIGENEELVCEVEAGSAAPLLDIDTPEALTAYTEKVP